MLYLKLASGYVQDWQTMKLRETGDYPDQIKTAVGKIMANREIYQECESETKIPWWWFPPAHYREGDLDFTTYFGNGDPLHRKTVNVPAGRGPFRTFAAGVADAMKIQGYLDCTDWTFPRGAFRWNKFNGFGYTHCKTPYLAAGTTLYGPPQAPGGMFIRDHVFSASAIDKRLGCYAVFKGMCEADGSIPVDLTILDQRGPQPDDTHSDVIAWVQAVLNDSNDADLTVDGALGKNTMAAVRDFQKQFGLAQTGLPNATTIKALDDLYETPPAAKTVPVAVQPASPVQPVSQQPPVIQTVPVHKPDFTEALLAFLDSLFHHSAST